MIQPLIIREPPFKTALIISMAVHIVCLAGFQLPAIWSASGKTRYYYVEVTGSVGGAQAAQTPTAAQTQPATPMEQEPPKKVQVDPIRDTVAIPKVQMGKKTAQAAQATQQTQKTAAANKPLFSLVAGNEDELPSGFGGFVGLIRDKVGQKWSPLWWSGAEIRQCEVHFVLLKDGTMTNIEILKPSGLAYLDRSALRALQEAQPFPPLPDGFIGDGLGITFRFELNRQAQ